MRIAPELLDQVVAHALRDAPDECCGLLGVRDGEAVSVHPTENMAASPYRFEIDGRVMLRLLDELEGRDAAPGLIYHSHTRSEPYPSQTDINFAKNWPGWQWLIVGTAGPEPLVRCYEIEGGEVREVTLA
ncbi:MAG TPA: M67 family metallopeptidase [Solirubrobacteraceae bacterium]|nr:M67 family metallopeptidase [Solirubrobacteraceae bacterium]